MNKYLIIVLLFWANNIYAQNKKIVNYPCGKDSLDYSIFLSQLDSLGMDKPMKMTDSSGIRKLRIYKFSTTIKSKLHQSDYCAFLLYVAGFNHLLNTGLDLDFNYGKHRPTRLSIMSIEEDKSLSLVKGKNDALREKHRIYKNFLRLKEDYERYIIDVYLTKENKVEFYNLIDSVILYGTYSKPETLRKILRSDFRHLSRDKLNQDIRKYFNENN